MKSLMNWAVDQVNIGVGVICLRLRGRADRLADWFDSKGRA